MDNFDKLERLIVELTGKVDYLTLLVEGKEPRKEGSSKIERAERTKSLRSLYDSDIEAPFTSPSPSPSPAAGEEYTARVEERAREIIKKPRFKAEPHSKLEQVASLRQAISVNDRFLLLRDIFHNDPDELERVINHLDTFTDLDDCLVYISENFNWNPHSDGVRALMDILGRKLQ